MSVKPEDPAALLRKWSRKAPKRAKYISDNSADPVGYQLYSGFEIQGVEA
jgi:hypothetical protein